MNDKIETQGKTVKDAVAEALLRLGARRDEVIVKIIEEPKSGFLGLLGGRPAKVQVEKKRGDRPRGGNRRSRNSRGHSLSEGPGEGRSRNEARGRSNTGRGRKPASRDDRNEGRGRRPQAQDQERGNRNENRSRNDNQRRDNSHRDAARKENAPRQGARRDTPRNDKIHEDNRGQDGRRGRNRRPRPAAARTEAADNQQNQPERAAAPEGRRDGNERSGSSDRNQRNRRGLRSRRPRPQDGDQPSAVERQATQETRSPAGRESRPVAEQTQPNSRPAAREITNKQEPPRMENKPTPSTGPTTDVVVREGLKGMAFAEATRGVAAEQVKETLEKLAGGMLVRAGFPCRCQVFDGEYLQVRVVTDDASAGMLIGRHGATVDSVEHLVERMISTASGDRVKMNLDINNYRRRRQDTLADRVFDAIGRVRETGRDYHMEPMNARERRLVHLQVEEVEGLTTVTVADDGAKHVVISREGAAEKEASEAPVAEAPVMPTEGSSPDSAPPEA